MTMPKDIDDPKTTVNAKCIAVEFPKVKFTVGGESSEQRVSNYAFVYWSEKQNLWRAQLKHEGKILNIGYFDKSNEAAQAVNEQCKKLGIPVKNPEVENVQETNLRSTSTSNIYKPNLEKNSNEHKNDFIQFSQNINTNKNRNEKNGQGSTKTKEAFGSSGQTEGYNDSFIERKNNNRNRYCFDSSDRQSYEKATGENQIPVESKLTTDKKIDLKRDIDWLSLTKESETINYQIYKQQVQLKEKKKIIENQNIEFDAALQIINQQKFELENQQQQIDSLFYRKKEKRN